MNLMTFNIRYDNPEDGSNRWANRKEYVADFIRESNIDILGIQEVLYNQLKDLLSVLPHYAYTGVGRKNGGTAGEFNAILYKKEKFSYCEGGTFWLSENPSAVGIKGWDAEIERIVTWVILKDRATSKKFAVFNTHFDHVGQVAKRESARLVLLKMKELSGDLPAIMTGDLNSVPDSEPIKILTNPADEIHLADSRSKARQITGPAWTFHGFGAALVEKRSIIDYIFIKNIDSVEQVSVIFEMRNNLYLSDHNPVQAIVTIN